MPSSRLDSDGIRPLAVDLRRARALDARLRKQSEPAKIVRPAQLRRRIIVMGCGSVNQLLGLRRVQFLLEGLFDILRGHFHLTLGFGLELALRLASATTFFVVGEASPRRDQTADNDVLFEAS